jgi:glycosyltransferase involved in cell wall biosynthesis
LLDDLATRRPWNARVKAARLRARARRRHPGVTVIIVNWNTGLVTADVVAAVKAFSPPATEVLLIDNGSTDGSAELFRELDGVRTVLLRSNAGHGIALDLGVCWARTEIVVTLDSDAVPLRPGWLDPAVEPIRLGEADLAGLRSRRGFVHPVYFAMDAREFLRRRVSFQVHRSAARADGEEDAWGTNAWDTGELLSREFTPERIRFVDPLPKAPDDPLPGMIVGDVVYHHGGVSRNSGGGATPEAFAGWRRACNLLGIGVVLPARGD